jgi:fatty-acyl-CoA synthase
MTTSVGSALHWWAKTKGDQTAIVVGEQALSYRQLHHGSSRLARRLVDDGVKPGDRVGLLAPNSLEWPVAALGILKSGAILVPFNARMKAHEVRKIADEAGLSVLLSAPSVIAAAEEARIGGTGFSVLDVVDVVDAERSGEADDFRVDRSPDEPISLIFTSGSTGLPKGVVLTTGTLMGIVLEKTLTEDGFRPDTVTLVALPMAFTPGLVYGLLVSTVLAGKLIIEPELNPARAVTLIEEHGVQVLFGVPLVFEAMSRTPEFALADLRSLRTAIVGGAAVPVELLRRWAEKDVLLRQIYGMTEAGGAATATLKSEALQHPGSCGSGSIFTDVRVMAADGSFAEPGQLGELVLRGPSVTPGYWNDPESTSLALRDGWLHSGDVGTCDEKGRITFVDRVKDLIISGGINISPVELEAVIATLDGVAEVAVIAAADERWGETPAAIITIAPGRDGPDEADVIAHCEEYLSDYKVPRYVVLRHEPLPRLPSGKLAKPAIRDQYRDISKEFTKVR